MWKAGHALGYGVRCSTKDADHLQVKQPPETPQFPPSQPQSPARESMLSLCFSRNSHLNPHYLIKYVSCIHTDLPNVLLSISFFFL